MLDSCMERTYIRFESIRVYLVAFVALEFERNAQTFVEVVC
jgi:hypothetical protein